MLYDQILRYCALSLAGDYFKEETWREKALKIKIKQYFLFEEELDDSLLTGSQRIRMSDFELSRNFIASFPLGNLVIRYDFWSIALLLLLKIFSKYGTEKLVQIIEQFFSKNQQRGFPTLWSVITE
ncbi:MAG: hypothetical protein ABI045_02070 [Flavobacteriales bacterium]